MKNAFMKRVTAAATALALLFTGTASADSWYQQGDNWFVLNEQALAEGKGMEFRTGWYQDEKKDWYYLEPALDSPTRGALQSGWLLEEGTWYFLNPVHDGYYGRAFANTWQWIDGYCYYFDENCKLVVNGITPDLYTVNQDGQWTVDGVPQYIYGKGILTKDLQASSGTSSGRASGGTGGSGGSGGSGGKNPVNNQEVTLTVVYQDADSNEIIDTKKLNGKPGESVRIEHPEFGGYTILDGQPVEAVFADKDTEVYVLYRKALFIGAVEVQYINTENSSLIASKTATGLLGEPYVVHIPVLDGYKAVSGQEDFAVTFGEEKQVAKVEYRPIQAGEETDQALVAADNVKVAQADTPEEKAVLDQIYHGIFDYQQYEDGTVEFAVYNDNPILDYALNGDYRANDVIYIEPNGDFPAGLTFIYQTHDDNYSGSHVGYNAENCEVIRGYQASPFSLFAPGTNLEIELSDLLSETEMASQTNWSLFGDDPEEASVRSVEASMTNIDFPDLGVSVLNSGSIKINKQFLENHLSEDGKQFINDHIKDFENTTSVTMSPKDFILKIHIPFDRGLTELFTEDTFVELQIKPELSVKNNTTVTFKRKESTPEYDDSKTLSNTINQDLAIAHNSADDDKENQEKISNAVKFKNLMIQGIDFDDLGLFPFAGQGFNLITKTPTIKIRDLINEETKEKEKLTKNELVSAMKSMNIYVGLIECCALDISGETKLTNNFTLSFSDYTIGMRWKYGERKVTNLSTIPFIEVDDHLSIEAEAEGKVGICLMTVLSFAGVTPVGIGVEAGLKLEDVKIKAATSLEANNRGKMEWSSGVDYSGKLAVYGSLDFHSRLLLSGGENKPSIELFPVNQQIYGKEWPLIDLDSEEITLTVKDENDAFWLCSEDGTELKQVVSPVWNEASGGWGFNCPAYVLLRNETGDQPKVGKVTGLNILPSDDPERQFWTQLILPPSVKELSISAKVNETFSYLHQEPKQLKKLLLVGEGSTLNTIDISSNKGLTELNVRGTALTNLDVHENSALRTLWINPGLAEFTGNGHVMPDLLEWFSEPECINPVTECKAGQTIYSGSQQPGAIIDENCLFITSARLAKYRALDEYGNDISATWPGYDEETGMVSPVLDPTTGKYSIKVPQYTQLNTGEPYKLTKFYLTDYENTQFSELDFSEAPDVESLYCVIYPDDDTSNKNMGHSAANLILPENLQELTYTSMGADGLNCDFSRAPNLSVIGMDVDFRCTTGLNLDFSKNEALKELSLGLGALPKTSTIKLPDTDTLQKVYIEGPIGKNSHIEGNFSQYNNLTQLELREVDIDALNLSDCKDLESLVLLNVPISKLELGIHPSLEKISINKSGHSAKINFTNVDFSAYPNLKELNLFELDPGKDLDFGNCKKLESLEIYEVPIKHLTLGSMPLLSHLILRPTGGSNISAETNFSKFTKLQDADLRNLAISSINISGCKNLEALFLANSPVLHLDISGNPALSDLVVICLLDTFTGNGIALPENFTWYSDEACNNETAYCSKGQTIYSDHYKQKKEEEEAEQEQTMLMNTALEEETDSSAEETRETTENKSETSAEESKKTTEKESDNSKEESDKPTEKESDVSTEESDKPAEKESDVSTEESDKPAEKESDDSKEESDKPAEQEPSKEPVTNPPAKLPEEDSEHIIQDTPKETTKKASDTFSEQEQKHPATETKTENSEK